MKKFLEELDKHPNAYQIVADSGEMDIIRKQMKEKYKPYIGKRALMTCKTTKEKRVVTLEKMYKDYILLRYKYYGPGYSGSCTTTMLYSSLHCGAGKLEVE